MRDQVAAAARAGIRAVEISSANMTEWDDIAARLAADDVDVLLVSPERLTNPRFREEQLPGLVRRCGLLVVDEAHCVSDWGHDFRPDYRRIRDLLGTLPAGTPVLATTATANERVVADVAEQLGAGGVEVTTVRGPLSRDSLRLGVLRLPSDRARLAWLAAHLGDLPGSGIVYTLTVAAAEETAALLRDAGHEVRAYTGRLDDADRKDAEEALRSNAVKALVATSALGMGFDKPDLGFVVHLGAPSSPVSYYQQVGRAGRAVEHADVLLLPGPEDLAIWQWFATSSMPREDHAAAVLGAMADGKAWSVARLETVADVRRSRLELLLKVLAVDGAVERVQGGWRSTGQPWVYDADRYARVHPHPGGRAAGDDRLRPAGRRGAVPHGLPAGGPRRPDRRPLRPLRRLRRPLVLRRRPRGGGRGGLGGAGPARCRARAAGAVADRRRPAGRRGEGQDRAGRAARARPGGRPADRPRLGAAAAHAAGRRRRRRHVLDLEAPGIEEDPDAAFDVPVRRSVVRRAAGRRAPPRVRARAGRLGLGGAAGCGGGHAVAPAPAAGDRPRAGAGPAGPAALPGRDVPAARRADRRAGRQQRLPAGRRLGAHRRRARSCASGWLTSDGPVLLVDDLADSRWTMTVAGRELRRAGAAAVLPFALALTA